MNLSGHGARTRLVPQALGASAGRAWLYAPHGEPKNASLVGQPDLPGGTTVEVATVTLDEVALGYPKVDLVKIDAESGEQGIVAGMHASSSPATDHSSCSSSTPPAMPSQRLSSTACWPITETLGNCNLHGDVVPLDRISVLDRTTYEDRLLVFE